MLPPVDITLRVWFDGDVEVFSPVADWLTCAAMNRALDSYVEYVVVPDEEDG